MGGELEEVEEGGDAVTAGPGLVSYSLVFVVVREWEGSEVGGVEYLSMRLRGGRKVVSVC